MSYQILARKWRPQDFSTLIGQDPIVTALRNALREGRIAQAYLFSGIRGVGKTTAARVLAKALNCRQGPAADPCNDCDPCRDITAGSDLDVIEIDAATYSKVEQVRELTESLQYGPARNRYKVIILDEIHRLSRQAFDALLKIVEEPPPHLTFIFATTEIEAVPATILSRCQEFHFRRVPVEIVARHLRELCEAESIEASDTSLRLIARVGEGSVRDAVALLDQLATFGSNRISDEEAIRLLGGLDTALFQRLLVAITQGASPEVSSVVASIEEQGWDPRHVYAQFLAYSRDALHGAMGGDPAQLDLPLEEAKNLVKTAQEAGYENLLRMIHQLLSSEETVRRSEASALAVEIAWLKAAELPKLTQIEDLLNGDNSAGPPPASPPKPPRQAGPESPSTSTARKPVAPSAAPATTASSVAPAERPAPGPSLPGADPDSQLPLPARSNGNGMEAFLQELSLRKQPLAAHLAEAHQVDFTQGELRIVIPQGDTWLTGALSRSENRQVLQEAVHQVWGEKATWRAVETSPDTLQEPPQAAAKGTGTADAFAIGEHPTIKKVLDIFGGTIHTVEQHRNRDPAPAPPLDGNLTSNLDLNLGEE